MNTGVFQLSPRITVLPVLHGSGDFAVEVRRVMLEHKFDCLAVPLPRSFKRDVEAAIDHLPAVTMVGQLEHSIYESGWSPPPEVSAFDPSASDDDDESDDEPTLEMSFVPIDPCQPVIAALRVAMGERMVRAFIDLETTRFQPYALTLPDPYAMKRVPMSRFASALLPFIPAPPQTHDNQPADRIATMAHRLHMLEQQHESVLFVCAMTDWPWVRDAYRNDAPPADDEDVEDTAVYQPDDNTLVFMLGELPYITGLYEQARASLDDDENLSVDGVKELLIATRQRYKVEAGKQARHISPKLLALCLKYIRNLSLIKRRLTPDLYTLVVAAQQCAGDRFAINLVEQAREYLHTEPTGRQRVTLGIDRARLPNGTVVQTVNRLPGQPMTWRSLNLKPKPERIEQDQWLQRWNPYSSVSWPPEDESVERFRTHCFQKAEQIINADLAHSEKFTTSFLDGLDVRETVRNWHTGDIYVKSFPPRTGGLDCVIMLFDTPADPRDYPFRMTWYAEHGNESTLALYGTDFLGNMIGPGIGQATYGGAMFLYPPVAIPEVWTNRQLDFADTLEDRLIAAGCLYSRARHVALLSPVPPTAMWRRIARRFSRKLVHLPLSHFSQSTVEQLRVFHVLNGREVRSYASRFIHKG